MGLVKAPQVNRTTKAHSANLFGGRRRLDIWRYRYISLLLRNLS